MDTPEATEPTDHGDTSWAANIAEAANCKDMALANNTKDTAAATDNEDTTNVHWARELVFSPKNHGKS
jgi:hypothetical protein